MTDKLQSGECNDANAAVHPLAVDICDFVDNDCDGTIDENVQTSYYRDVDTDSYGNPAISTGACETAPAGYTGDNTDCDDTDGRKHPATLRYIDADTDGFSSGTSATQCTGPASYYLPGQLVVTSTSGAGLKSGLVQYVTFDRLDARNEGSAGGTGTFCQGAPGTGCNGYGPTLIAGKISKALSFNGINNGVNMPSYSSTNHSFSRFAWIRVSAYPASMWKYIFAANSGIMSFRISPDGSVSDESNGYRSITSS